MNSPVDDATLARMHAQHVHLCSPRISIRPREPVAIETFRTVITAAFWQAFEKR